MSKEKNLTSVELAARWGIHPGTLAHWRVEGKGPAYQKTGTKVSYTLEAIVAYERENTITPTSENQPKLRPAKARPQSAKRRERRQTAS